MISLRAVVDPKHRVRLRLRQATGLVAVAAANERVRVELAIPRIVDDPVENAVQPIARGDDLRMDIGKVASQQEVRIPRGQRDIARGDLVGQDPVGVMIGVLHVHVVRGCTGRDPVEILRVPLRRHQRFPAAIRASVEIRIGRRPPVEVADDRLCNLRRNVHAAIGEVDPRPRLVDDPRCTFRAHMAHVGRGRDEFTCDYWRASG